MQSKLVSTGLARLICYKKVKMVKSLKKEATFYQPEFKFIDPASDRGPPIRTQRMKYY